MPRLKSRRSFDSAVPPRTWPTHYGPVSPICPRTAINSQRSSPAATCDNMKLARAWNPASNARDTLVMRRSSGSWPGLQSFRLRPRREFRHQAGICRPGGGGRVRDGGPDAMRESPDSRLGDPAQDHPVQSCAQAAERRPVNAPAPRPAGRSGRGRTPDRGRRHRTRGAAARRGQDWPVWPGPR
jgi:hypothetical protein